MKKQATFYLNSNKGQTSANILMQLKFNGTGIVYSTGKNISSKTLWDKEVQRAKHCPETKGLNDTLDKIETVALETLRLEQNKLGVPDPKVIKAALDILLEKKHRPAPVKHETLFTLLTKFGEGKIERGGKKLSINSGKSYVRLKNHIFDFQKDADFSSITVEWWTRYKNHLAKTLNKNSIRADLKLIKAVMRYANENGFTSNKAYENSDFTATGQKVESGYLTQEQVNNLPRGPILDYFILACESGARFSDWDKFNADHVKNGWFTYTSQKTGTQASIQCSELFLAVYRDNMPELPNYWICNRAVKKAAGVSPHEARRSFCTNRYISGMSVQLIMTMSGHATESSFMSYLKLDLETSRKLQREFAEKQGKPVMAKVA